MFILILCSLMFCLPICVCDGVRSPGTGVPDSGELPHGGWELNLSSPEEQPMFLIAEPFFQPWLCNFFNSWIQHPPDPVDFTLHFLPAGPDLVPAWVQHLLGGVCRRCYDITRPILLSCWEHCDLTASAPSLPLKRAASFKFNLAFKGHHGAREKSQCFCSS